MHDSDKNDAPEDARSARSAPFRHLPHLCGRIADPAGSRFRNLDYRAIDAMLAEAGITGWRRSDEKRETTRQAALAGRMEDDLWVFAYGSLMWDPAFHFAEVRHARTDEFHRSFCLRSEIGRGSPDRPGLMAALDAGGKCDGLAFRIAAATVDTETRIIWAREMIAHAYAPRFIALATPQGPVEALAFVIDPLAHHYMPGLSLEQRARLIATGEGLFGPCLAYLDQLAEHFALLGITDEPFLRLHGRAREIAGRG